MSIRSASASRRALTRSHVLGTSRIEPLESRIAPAVLVAISDHVDSTNTADTLTYSIDFSNSGTAAVTGVLLADALPSGTTFEAAENTGWTLDGGVLHFTAGDLAAGAAGQATLVLHVAPVAPAALASIHNAVSIFHGGSATADNEASDTDSLNAAPDLQVTKTRQGEGTITTGSSLVYNITYANTGDQDATGVKLTEHLPAGTTFDATNSAAGWTETTAGSGIFTLTIGAVSGGGGSDSRTFAVTVKSTAASGLEQISNTVDVADDGTNGTDPTTANNTNTLALDLSAAPDLSLTKTTAATTTAPGGSLTFSFSYANSGNQDAAGVTITDTLPAYATFDATANTGWTLTGTTLKFTVGSVAAGAAAGSATLVLKVANTVDAGVEQFSNTASIADNGTGGVDANLQDNTSTVSIPLDAAPTLALTKSDGRDTAHAGETITYTLGYSNTGNQGASGVVITDTLPTGTSFDPAANPGWTDDGSGHLSFTVGTVAAGANGSAALVLKVASELPDGLTTIANTATIADDGTATDTKTDSDFIVSAVDLTLHKTSESSSVTPGGTIIYHFDYTNAGDLNATGATLTDVLPAGTTFSGADNPGWVQAGNTLTYTLGSVAAGGAGTILLSLGAVSTASAGMETISNTATITDDGTHGTDFTPADNTSTLSVSLNAAADLHLTKTSDGSTVTPTSAITYHFTYGNSGNQISSGAKITDVLPSGLNFNADANPGWTLANGTLTYSVGTLAPGTDGTATLVLAVAASAPAGVTQISNTAIIGDDGTSGADANITDNSSTATNPLDAHYDLVIANSTSTTSAAPFAQVNYTLTYSNAGNQTASNVVLEETLPAGTTFNAGASTTGWTLVTPGVYHLTVASLAGGGASNTATFAVNVNSPVAAGLDKIHDTATISGDGTDSDLTNNSASAADVTIDAAPNLAVSQTASSTSITRGGMITYSITYANVGNQAATGAFLTETLPAGFTFVAAGSSTGWTLASNGDYRYDIGNLGVTQSVTLTFEAHAPATAVPGSHPQNHVTIADDIANGTDPNLANNSSVLALPIAGATSGVSTSTSSSTPHKSHGIMAFADGDTIKVIDRDTGGLLLQFRPFGKGDVGHIDVALGDVNGDGIADIIATSSKDHKVRAFDGATGLRLLYAGHAQREISGDTDNGPATIAAADFNGDGVADLVVGEGAGGGEVKIYDGKTGQILSVFSPFGDTADGGIAVGVGDVNGDGIADILVREHGDQTLRTYDGTTIGNNGGPTLLTFSEIAG